MKVSLELPGAPKKDPKRWLWENLLVKMPAGARCHPVNTLAPKWYKKQQSIPESRKEDSSSSSGLLRKQNV